MNSIGAQTSKKLGLEQWIVIALFLFIVIQCLPLLNTWSPTFDAFAHTPAGYAYWKQNNFEIYKHNPPLIQLIIASPLLLLNPELPPKETSAELTRWEYARAFHELNTEIFDQIFFWARVPVLLMSLALAFVVYRWCRSWYGAAGGITGLSLLALNPFYMAHSQLATLDVGCALFTTLMFWTLSKYLASRKWTLFLAFALFFGLCQAAKFSSLLLYAVAPLLLLVCLVWPTLTNPNGKRIKRPSWQMEGLVPVFSQFCLLCLISLVVIAAVFGFDQLFEPIKSHHFVSQQMQEIQNIPEIGNLPSPFPYYYLEGLDAQNYLNNAQFANYLFGERSTEGFWNYFSVAFLAKHPLGFLGLLAIALPIWFVLFLRKKEMRWLFLLLPFVIYLVYFSFMITVQCGLRYLLPVIPLIVIFIAMAGQKLWEKNRACKAVLCTAIGVNLISCLSIHPDYISYFNEAFGGPENGRNVIVATDLDWGQDLKRFRDYVQEHPEINNIQADLFGKIEPTTYGIPNCRGIDKYPSPGWLVLSVNKLINAFSPEPDRSWLLEYKPVKEFGFSLGLYHITEEDLLRQFSGQQIRAFQLANKAEPLIENNPIKAEALLAEAIRLYPDSWQLHCGKGHLHVLHKNKEKAMKHIKEAMRLKPDNRIYVLLDMDDRAE